jgi:hypothetical protein
VRFGRNPLPPSNVTGRRRRPRPLTAATDHRARIEPLDPSAFRGAGECERRDTTDPAVIKLILNVKLGMSEGYDWVTCNACQTSWQVPHYAEESVG